MQDKQIATIRAGENSQESKKALLNYLEHALIEDKVSIELYQAVSTLINHVNSYKDCNRIHIDVDFCIELSFVFLQREEQKSSQSVS